MPEIANLSLELGNWIRINFFKVFFFSKYSSGHVKCKFDNRIEDKFPSRCWNSLARSPKTSKKNIFFPKNVFLLKLFPWTLRLHFWQICRNFLAKSPKGFCSDYDNSENVFFSKLMFPQLIPLDTQSSILTSLRNYLGQKLDNVLQITSKNDAKKCRFSQKQSSKLSSVDTKNCFDNSAEIFLSKIVPEKLRSKSGNWRIFL